MRERFKDPQKTAAVLLLDMEAQDLPLAAGLRVKRTLPPQNSPGK
jgi:hypothetical protein